METAARARVQASPRPTRGLPAHHGVTDGAKQPGTEQTPGYGDETIPGLGRPPHGCSPEPDRGNRVILGPRRYTPGRALRGPARRGRPRSAAAGDHRGRSFAPDARGQKRTLRARTRRFLAPGGPRGGESGLAGTAPS